MHAHYNPQNHTLIIKSVGGNGENRVMEHTNYNCYLFWATHGHILWRVLPITLLFKYGLTSNLLLYFFL